MTAHRTSNANESEDCKKRAHAFIQRCQEAEKVELPGWLARKIAWYILSLEKKVKP